MSDHELGRAVSIGQLGIEPYDRDLLQPNSYDVTLDRHFLVPLNAELILDTADVPHPHMRAIESSSFTLARGGFALCSTREVVRLPRDIVGQVEGKSSLGRLGLLVHVTAGVIDSGFEGHITLELVNHSPWDIKLHAGMTIAQLCFTRVSPVQTPYAGRYQNQRGPVESRYAGVV